MATIIKSWRVASFRDVTGPLIVIGALAPKPGLGNINPQLYRLAQSSPGVFHDTVAGDDIVSCGQGGSVAKLETQGGTRVEYANHHYAAMPKIV